MEQIRHGSATTAHAVQAAIQQSQALPMAPGQVLGIRPKMVTGWHGSEYVVPKKPCTTRLSEADETMVAASRRHFFYWFLPYGWQVLFPLPGCQPWHELAQDYPTIGRYMASA